MGEQNFEYMAVPGGAPVKMWTKGVPVDDKARDQLSRAAKMPFIFKHVAAMPVFACGPGEVRSTSSCVRTGPSAANQYVPRKRAPMPRNDHSRYVAPTVSIRCRLRPGLTCTPAGLTVPSKRVNVLRGGGARGERASGLPGSTATSATTTPCPST